MRDTSADRLGISSPMSSMVLSPQTGTSPPDAKSLFAGAGSLPAQQEPDQATSLPDLRGRSHPPRPPQSEIRPRLTRIAPSGDAPMQAVCCSSCRPPAPPLSRGKRAP